MAWRQFARFFGPTKAHLSDGNVQICPMVGFLKTLLAENKIHIHSVLVALTLALQKRRTFQLIITKAGEFLT